MKIISSVFFRSWIIYEAIKTKEWQTLCLKPNEYYIKLYWTVDDILIYFKSEPLFENTKITIYESSTRKNANKITTFYRKFNTWI